MNPKIRILYLEDRSEDMELVQAMLERDYLPCELVWVNTRAAYLSALRDPWSYDLIVADYFLPDIGGDEALELARKHAATLPFIFLSGSLGEERAVECLRKGATDYVFKSNLARLRPVLRRALDEARVAEARREAEAASARVAALLRATLESTSEGLLVVDLAGRISAYNRKFLALFGIPEYVMARMDLEEVIQFLTGQFDGPNALLEEIRLLRSRPEKETSGILTLNGGRSLEQTGRPQRVGSETVGRVLSIRETQQRGLLDGLQGLNQALLAGQVAPWFLDGDRLVLPDSALALLGVASLPRNLAELADLLHPQDAKPLLQALEHPQRACLDARIRRHDGTWGWTRWTLDLCGQGYCGVLMVLGSVK
jgi:CheY-like chemotaxis protein